MILNSFGGLIQPGDYDVVVAQGWCQLKAGVRFATLIIRGVVIAGACNGGRIIMQSGVLSCDGDLTVDSIEGQGNLDIHGSLRCGRITLTGEMTVTSRIQSGSSVVVFGMLEAESLCTPGDVRMIGHCSIGSIDACHLVVKPIRSAMFERFDMKKYLTPSRFDLIEAQVAQVHWIRCRKIVADDVELTGHSDIRELVYAERFRRDVSSSVELTRFIGDPAYRNQRKVA
ncbi:hypothetical protein GA0061078_0411 [Bifidobacterium bohemicum]|uniref:Polymer-forming cytoskeletal n=1 Tax=Bifidobacterium bohemicum DSM 22767 TaxID=1437606 RepID=A0A086ZJF8_9BIFI|nr:hypothetical protein [Bifidobacterium bohemicum]KFI46658.1 hypothetical protein BBOH_0130 [Bifidobacterium bohemicum DSM 22767]SCB77991.1 hypothetical protein GA0061078_0411 [Bifidobacterium bohemicum]